MNIVFTKQSVGHRGGESLCDLLVTVNKKQKQTGKDSLVVRLSADLLERSGWKVGNRCLLRYDGSSWTLDRTNDEKNGFKVSRSMKTNTKTGTIKLTLNKDKQVQLGMLPGDRHECDAAEASGQRIVAVVKR